MGVALFIVPPLSSSLEKPWQQKPAGPHKQDGVNDFESKRYPNTISQSTEEVLISALLVRQQGNTRHLHSISTIACGVFLPACTHCRRPQVPWVHSVTLAIITLLELRAHPHAQYLRYM